MSSSRGPRGAKGVGDYLGSSFILSILSVWPRQAVVQHMHLFRDRLLPHDVSSLSLTEQGAGQL